MRRCTSKAGEAGNASDGLTTARVATVARERGREGEGEGEGE